MFQTFMAILKQSNDQELEVSSKSVIAEANPPNSDNAHKSRVGKTKGKKECTKFIWFAIIGYTTSEGIKEFHCLREKNYKNN